VAIEREVSFCVVINALGKVGRRHYAHWQHKPLGLIQTHPHTRTHNAFRVSQLTNYLCMCASLKCLEPCVFRGRRTGTDAISSMRSTAAALTATTTTTITITTITTTITTIREQQQLEYNQSHQLNAVVWEIKNNPEQFPVRETQKLLSF